MGWARLLLIGAVLGSASWLWFRDDAASKQPGLDETADFATWASACLSLPSNRGAMTVPVKNRMPLKEVGPLYRLVDETVTQARDLAPWVGQEDFASSVAPFRPFAQKLALPSGSRVIVHGDLHGDVRSLIVSLEDLQRRKILSGFKVTTPNTHLVFLGDYTDRGFCGVEVLYTLMRLKLANPVNVWLTRGNHEDLSMIERYGFEHEGQLKFGRDFEAAKVAKLFDGLPSVIYVGTNGNFLQSCHGGVEPGYDPRELLQTERSLAYERLGELKRAAFRSRNKALFEKLVEPTTEALFQKEFIDFLPSARGVSRELGFMWYDFTLYQNDVSLSSGGAGARMMYGQDLTEGILEAQSTPTAKIRGVLRAHQHSRLVMERLLVSKGVFRHWQEREALPEEALPADLETDSVRPVVDGGVYTFNVSPDSVYGKAYKYYFQTFGILTLAEDFEDWRLEIVNLEVPTFPKS